MRLWFLLIVGLVGTGILVWLGTWQVQRLAWKQDLLARIDAQIGADPVPLGDAVTPTLQRYAPVTLSGQFGQGHVRMLASRKSIGPVHRIIRPFDAEGFGRVLVDTGWQPDGAEVPAAPSASLTLIGNLDAPQEADGFTPGPDRAANLWFARDVPAMAETLDTQPILVVLRDAPEMNLGVTPWPVDTAGIPNDHLQYAITWFSLALIWGAMTGLFLLRTRRGAR
ncbi:MAG: SURF1 family protein [Pseudomonadota bacterium]